MTFRSGDLKRDKSSSLSIVNLHEGQKVDGRVKRVEDYGLFVAIEGSKISGLCHKSEVCILCQGICLLSTILMMSFDSYLITRTRMSQLRFVVTEKVTRSRS